MFVPSTILAGLLLLPSLLLASPLAAPAALDREASLLEVYGSKDTWQPIYADGSHSVIVGYSGVLSAEQSNRANELAATDPASHAAKCYGSGSWVPLYQLNIGKDAFCKDIHNKNPQKGNYYWQIRYTWNDKGTQRPFINHKGQNIPYVYFEVRLYSNWNLNSCYQGFIVILAQCKGSNPDSAGGEDVYSNHWLRIDPSE